mmetsp:Transcript_16166/g.48885  ORF Transcript_16166/g.48885 Transcript_16166/m.48885 type:complete len:263 (+) Transcript_16166:68-856(+)
MFSVMADADEEERLETTLSTLARTPGYGWKDGQSLKRSGSATKPLAPPAEEDASSSSDQDEDATVAAAKKKVPKEVRVANIAAAVATILENLGEDPTREGLLKTPKRMAELLVECTSGYEKKLETVINGAVFHEDYSEMVVVKDINVFSLCEHHVVPFFGKVHIAYIPRDRVLGLSKLARISKMYAQRLQVQERLTRQIADAVVDAVSPLGVGVVVEAQHMCMAMRGACQPSSTTVTSAVRGCFQADSRTRAEFFANVGRVS